MKKKKLSKTEIYMISFTVILVLAILLTWKNFKLRMTQGLENYKAAFEQVDSTGSE